MKLVQKILSHGLLIAFVVAAFFAYTNRAELVPQWFGKSAGTERQAATEKSDVVVAQAPAERKVTRPLPEKTISKIPVAPADETTPANAPESGSEAVAPAPAHVTTPATPLPDEGADDETGRQETAPVPVTMETPIPAAPPETVTAGAAAQARQASPAAVAPAIEATTPPVAEVQPAEATQAPAPAAAVATETAVTATPPVEAVPSVTAVSEATEAGTAPAESPVSTAVESAPRPAAAAADAAAVQPAGGQKQVLPEQTAAVAAPLEQQLEAARQLYWQRDVRAAAAAYQALGEAQPQNPDVWGEIGNFYFSLHQREPAGEAYARCIELLIDQGEPARARQLLNILHRLDESRARELETRIQ